MISKAENICDLEQIVDSLLKKEQDYLAEIKLLKEQLKFFKNMVFNRISEKETVEDKQLFLFEMPEELFPLAEKMNDEEPIIEVPAHKRKKRGRKPIPDNLPRVDALHDIPESEKLCECGCIKECIGQEVSEQLDIIPQKIQLIRHIRPKYACKSCEGVESNGPTVAIAPMPEQIIPKSIATLGLIAYVLVDKFVDALPFYRQEKQFLRIGVEISRASMCGWAQKVAATRETSTLTLDLSRLWAVLCASSTIGVLTNGTMMSDTVIPYCSNSISRASVRAHTACLVAEYTAISAIPYTADVEAMLIILAPGVCFRYFKAQ